MHSELVSALEVRRGELRENWEHLLRVEKVTSALAHPDTLVHLLDTTLDELFALMREASDPDPVARPPACPCPCGRNPLLAYFVAGRQAVREMVVLVQASLSAQPSSLRDSWLTTADTALAQIASREIDGFCSVCQYRALALTPFQLEEPAHVQPSAEVNPTGLRNPREHRGSEPSLAFLPRSPMDLTLSPKTLPSVFDRRHPCGDS